MSKTEKIDYGVVMASRELRHYFESHKIKVLIERSLSNTYNNPEASDRIAKWAMELSEYHVSFESRGAIKSQVLTDFIVGWTRPDTPSPLTCSTT